jgi:hypothetical protein
MHRSIVTTVTVTTTQKSLKNASARELPVLVTAGTACVQVMSVGTADKQHSRMRECLRGRQSKKFGNYACLDLCTLQLNQASGRQPVHLASALGRSRPQSGFSNISN